MSAAGPHVARDGATLAAARGIPRGIRAAFVTLTRLPVGGFPYTDDEWRGSTAHLPLVGACLGGALALVGSSVMRAGGTVAALIVTAASLLLTGAMHEDGLADTADALGGGGADRDRILRILKDSRVGTYGASALAVSLALRVALLARLGPHAPVALVLAESASRVVPVLVMTRLPYVSDPGAQKNAAVVRAGTPQLVVAGAWGVAIGLPCAWCLLPSPLSIVLVVMVPLLVGVGAVAFFRARVGGFTGDLLGAAQQVTWIALLCAFAVARGEAP